MGVLESLELGFAVAMTWENLAYCLLGVSIESIPQRWAPHGALKYHVLECHGVRSVASNYHVCPAFPKP